MTYRLFFLFLCTLMVHDFCYAQDRLVEVHSYYDADIVEWDLFTEESEGKLEMTWQSTRDKTEWSYEIGEYAGIIRKKWKGDSDIWEISNYDGYTVTFSPKWRNDNSEWLLDDGEHKLTFRSKYTNDPNYWETYNSKYGELRIIMEYENDPRDWLIDINTLDPDLSFEYTLAASFICLYVTTLR